jgi:hypothetical protein
MIFVKLTRLRDMEFFQTLDNPEYRAPPPGGENPPDAPKPKVRKSFPVTSEMKRN